ncbi:hypothetical protein C1645_848209 [Glomus cerebriforme]|uniref:DUF7431 domain-containing protein n=1 Tax=Glomus cerebriforme TaxID=658196 RepID=A0A397SY64_9GLOM|nr:hypothetical protein C1645_848209 [Glomus cerebriforme]
MVFDFKLGKNFFKNNKYVIITVHIPSQRPISVKLNLDDYLLNIRKVLENDKIIDDTLSFSKKISHNNEDNNLYKFSKIAHEEKFQLNEIIEIIGETYSLYLIKNLPDWQALINLRKLDYGCTMAFDGIKIAEKKAFIISNCELNLIGAEGYKKGRLEFESQNDWMEKTNLFFNVDGNITNFVKLGLSAGNSKNKNFNDEIKSAYEYTELGKKYGQFIPTKIILGGRVYFKDFKILSENSAHKSEEISANAGAGISNLKIGYSSGDSKKSSKFYSFNHMRLLGGKHPDDENFNEKAWIESLEDYQNWDRIELQNPISIFKLLPDDLRKKTLESIGKRILYTSIEDFKYNLNENGKPEIVDLTSIPTNISEILQNKEADCDIFATVIDTEDSKNDFFNCQILCPSSGKPKPGLIIHCIQNKFRKREYKLKIRIMIIGYDTEFDFLRPDFNVQLKVLKNKFNASSNQMLIMESLNFEHRKGPPCIGIPVLNTTDSSNNSLVIGHHYFNVQEENKLGTCTFSYCLKQNHYVNLPDFAIYTLIISNYPISVGEYGIIPFKRDNIIDNILNKSTKPYKPKYISLYSEGKSHCGPIFPKQKSEQIKIKYLKCLNCKKSCSICKKKVSTKNIECKFFDPYISERSVINLEQN